MNPRAKLLKQLKAHHKRQKDSFDRWRALGYQRNLRHHHEPMPEELQHIPCAAKTRAGTLCRRTDISSNSRCKYHGGHSTGAITVEGKARQLAKYHRWRHKLLIKAEENT